jgi:sterol desaturase/sphingolipid hydroxylase (fatty acid hydroxylase superfamily)
MSLFATDDLSRAFADIPTDLLSAVVSMAALLCIAVVLEKCAGYARQPSARKAWFNVRYTLVMLAILSALRPAALVVPLTITRAFGTGWIRFGHGITGSCCAFVAVLVMTDLLEYLFHRAQHTFGFLWKMHEFHHSADHYDVTLGYRHFWLEPLIKMTLVYPLIGIVFAVPAGVGAAVGIVFLVNHHLSHLNVRFSPRRFGLFVSHPQYHRLHHSRHEAHYNKNFCDLLPLWDVLFRTLQRPVFNEFVDVGLDSGETAHTLLQALAWPWRRATPEVDATAVGNA